jgi:hypothetical protein
MDMRYRALRPLSFAVEDGEVRNIEAGALLPPDVDVSESALAGLLHSGHLAQDEMSEVYERLAAIEAALGIESPVVEEPQTVEPVDIDPTQPVPARRKKLHHTTPTDEETAA